MLFVQCFSLSGDEHTLVKLIFLGLSMLDMHHGDYLLKIWVYVLTLSSFTDVLLN